MKKAKAKMKSVGHTCANPECRRDFTNPIVVKDLSSKDSPSYQACPFCLTRLVEKVAEVEEKPREKKGTKTKEAVPQHPKVVPAQLEQQPYAGEPKCPYHFGYLSHRSRKETIPEECMTCEKIVECMLKRITE